MFVATAMSSVASVVLGAASALLPVVAAAQEVPAQARIVAMSDVHGAYDSFVEVLRAAKLVDAGGGWTGGNAALVVVGDVTDRGAGTRLVLELLMRLEAAAPAHGGRVQLVLGNHEVMNLTGELGYVSAADYAAYAGEESAAEREAAWQRFRAARAVGGSSEQALAADFAKRYPPGFFAQRRAFSSNGAIGAWLLRQPVMAVVGDTLFVHGGLPASLDSKPLDEINAEYGGVLRDYVRSFETLRDAAVLRDEDEFGARPELVRGHLEAAKAAGESVPADVRAAVDRLVELTAAGELGVGAVYWYRGSVSCSPALERDRVARVLGAIGASRVVVGHTPVATARVQSRFDGTLLRVDTGMQQRGGRPSAIVIENGQAHALYAGEGSADIGVQPSAVGVVPRGYDDRMLEDALAHAPIAGQFVRENGTRVLRLVHEGTEIEALFAPVTGQKRGDRFVPEVAAYRLDRLLGLELVPVAVLRDIDGQTGAVYLDQSSLPDEAARLAQRAGGDAWCPLTDQFGLMYVLDSVAGSEGRQGAELRYEPASWQLVLTGNRRMFGAAKDLPGNLRAAPIAASPTLLTGLRELDAAKVSAALDDVLDARRQQALLARRDRLLARLQN
jgi:hypothetical protein